MATLTESGLIIDGLSDILNRNQKKAEKLFADIIPVGEKITTDSASVLGRIIQIQSEIAYLQEEAIQEFVASLTPSNADGRFLDKLAQFKDLKRKAASMGSASLVLYGELNALVDEGSLVSSNLTGDTFSTNSPVVFSNKRAAGIEIEIVDIVEGGSIGLQYSLINDFNNNPPIGISYQAGMTRQEIAEFMKTNIENLAPKLKVVVTNDYNVQIKPTQDGLIGDFYITGSAKIVKSFMPVNATSIYTVDAQEVNTLTSIQTPTLGWLGVTNLFRSIPSKSAESDAELRSRFLESSGTLATGHLASMYTAIKAIEGVTYVKITENKFPTALSDGRAGHGFAVIVQGGDDEKIALAIERTRPLGVPMTGDVAVAVNNFYSHTSTVYFSRPVQVPIRIKAKLTIREGFPATGVLDIKNAVINYFNTLTFGEDIILSRLYIPLQSVTGVGIQSLMVAKGDETYNSQDIEISYNEIATISFENIEI